MTDTLLATRAWNDLLEVAQSIRAELAHSPPQIHLIHGLCNFEQVD